MPLGPLKLAAIPVPSVAPTAPVPAMVLTTPAVVTALIQLESATYPTPEASVAIPWEEKKLAAVPWPLVKDDAPFPASVVTFHRQGGSVLSLTAPQLADTMQGVAPAPPPVQNEPTEQAVSTLPAQ